MTVLTVTTGAFANRILSFFSNTRKYRLRENTAKCKKRYAWNKRCQKKKKMKRKLAQCLPLVAYKRKKEKNGLCYPEERSASLVGLPFEKQGRQLGR